VKPLVHSRISVKKYGGVIEDFLKAIYGDHVRVKVTREKVEINEYQHD